MVRLILALPLLVIALLLTLPFLIILIPIWAFVFLFNSLNRYQLNQGKNWDEIIQFEKEIGWKPKPNLKNIKYFDRSGDSGTTFTDGEGWPGSYEIEESDIVVFGDSFAFGFGSKMEASYFGLNSEIRIKPVAAPGYNMVQALMLMKKYREKLENKTVFLFICLENDLAENLKAYNPKFYTNPFVKFDFEKDEWRIESSHVQQGKWLYGDNTENNRLLFAHICTENSYSEKVFACAEYLLTEADQICRSVNAELAVFTIPDKRQLSTKGAENFKVHLKDKNSFNPDYPDLKIGAICKGLDVPFIAGKSSLKVKNYKIRDNHWNRSGNKIVSKIIYNHYQEK